MYINKEIQVLMQHVSAGVDPCSRQQNLVRSSSLLAHYLVLTAAECAWLLLLFNLAGGRLSRRVAI